MRRFPGEWVRRQTLIRAMYCLALGSGCIGFATGLLFDSLLMLFLDQEWEFPLSVAVMPAAMALIPWLWRELDRGYIAVWLKDADAERHIGQVIEYALAVPHCAAAHSVTGLTAGGDIDHLVATPAGLRVVETKAGRVPPKRFRPVLARMALHAKAVRDWAPPGTPVRCCLVLRNPDRTGRKDYDSDGERIALLAVRELRRTLSAEAGERLRVAPELARAVWRLGIASDAEGPLPPERSACRDRLGDER